MKAFILSLVAVAALAGSSSSFAADMPLKAPPPPPIYDWSGTYIGINGGWSWAQSRQRDDIFSAIFPGVGLFDTGQYNQRGGLVGGTWGGNWQTGHIVAGFETDLDWANITGTSAPTLLCFTGLTFTCFTTIHAISTERLRFGYDFNGFLAYVTGGAAWGNVTAGQTSIFGACASPFVPAGFNICGNRNIPGWSAGAGVEWMFAPHWSVKAEWIHYDLGNNQFYNTLFNLDPIRATERGDMIRGGINYHFDLFAWIK
jgi:outer membrane immunogenic protein